MPLESANESAPKYSKICIPFIKIQLAYSSDYFILPKRIWEQFAYFRLLAYDKTTDHEEERNEIPIVFTSDFTSLWEFLEDMKHPSKSTVDYALQIKESCNILGLDEDASLRGKLCSLYLCAATNCVLSNWEINWEKDRSVKTISESWESRHLYKMFCIEVMMDEQKRDPRDFSLFKEWLSS